VNLLKRHASLIWLLLMAATVVTTWVLAKDAFSARVGTVAIFAIAAYKVRLVLLDFMELRHAPLPLRLAFEAWVLVATAAVVAIYLRTPLIAA
jgi:heme/copper-type cytochrome/quinol oxidase subunit 4